MLDSDTKRRIDTCRDILVGKVPDPKSQVEQITIALIYKFMDDMDAEAEELGGKRTFFAGEYEKYGWSKLMAPNMGGFDVLALYSEAIQKMNENPGIPALFRDIFKNAYLPYRDPETLRSFLKEIDVFTYDHSERLGDAFEYLLSVLGSQGDAGQFRTPRHIIDFMVEIIDPRKDESILDPACGTAGFLISAWKHILKNNTSNPSPSGRGAGVRDGDLLTPDERKRLAANMHGYDISPDMVRLSLVNMYLHGFTDPHIVEYDTLTSEEKWNEYADVILANPPFMSPKGGIKPHKRFSVQATRSEVLFVDYMAEHLTPNGRAAIIVPEGIIFQSGSAYKQLREMLVKTSLVAVVSLPAGVFNPYSGVKTSILVLDKRLAKNGDSVLFAKVENDGFNLGAQRRAIVGSDLPEIARQVREWLASGTCAENVNLSLVTRERIGESGEWNLSGERYNDRTFSHAKFQVVQLGEVCEINPRKSALNGHPEDTVVSFVPMQDLSENNISFAPNENRKLGEVSKGAYTYFRDNDVLVAKVTPCFENGKAGLATNLTNGIGFGSSEYYVLRASDQIIPEIIYHFVTSLRFRNHAIPKMTGTGGLQRVPKNVVNDFQIPLPPLKVQKEIVAEIEGYQKIIDGARQVVANYHPRIQINPDWPMVELGEVIQFVSGLTVSIPECQADNGIPIIAINNVTEEGQLTLEGLRTIEPPKKTLNFLKKGDLLFNWRNGSQHLVGKTALFDLDGQFLFASFLLGIRPDFTVWDNKFLWILLNNYRKEGKYMQFMRQNVNGLFNREELKITTFPLPDLDTQRAIVAQIEEEQRLVNANKELIRIFEQKIKTTINRVWGEEA